jgi:hypothetical protein
MNLENMCLFALKSSIGIQKLQTEETDPLYEEVNEFVLCERALEPIGLTCYLSSALLALNACRKFVLWYMIKEPFPFPNNSFSNILRIFLTEFRMLSHGPHSYKPILQFLHTKKPLLYGHLHVGDEVLGDSLESI